VCFCAVERLQPELEYDAEKADGRILIALCETEEERSQRFNLRDRTPSEHEGTFSVQSQARCACSPSLYNKYNVGNGYLLHT